MKLEDDEPVRQPAAKPITVVDEGAFERSLKRARFNEKFALLLHEARRLLIKSGA